MTIGERIKRTREKCGLSQTELAEKIGVSKQTLYKYENNIVTNIPSNKIELLADKLGVSESYIMGWEEEIESIDFVEVVNAMFDPDLKLFFEAVAEMRKQNEEKFKRLKSYMEFLKVEHD